MTFKIGKSIGIVLKKLKLPTYLEIKHFRLIINTEKIKTREKT